MDTEAPIKKAWHFVWKHFKNEDVTDAFLNTFLGEPVMFSARRFFGEELANEVVMAYRDYQRDMYLDEIEPFKGMDQLAKELKAAGYYLGVITSRMRASLMDGLRQFGLVETFDVIMTPEKTDWRIKPDPEPFLMALAELDAEPERALMIGDSEFDVRGARNAGVTSVLVDWSLPLPAEHRHGVNKPDYVIKEAEDLWEILAQIGITGVKK